jgi:hypothetical protein
MSRRRWFRWIPGVVVIAVLTGAAVVAFLHGRGELAREVQRERTVKVPPRTSRSTAGEIVVTLDPEAQKRIALRTETLVARTLQPEVAAYGTLLEDSSRSFTLRAPLAGQLARANGREWPSIGDTLADRAQIGVIEPRFAPVDRIDLAARLAAARADVDAVAASLAAARQALDRARALNAENRIVSDRAVQEAEARVKGEEARLRALHETVRLLDASVSGRAGPTGAWPLVLERGGEVVEVVAQPGESVESGQAILRVARFDRLVARVHLSAGQVVDRLAPTARIVVFGHEARPLRGERLALGATADEMTHGQALLYRVKLEGLPIRPGAAVTAFLPATGRPQAGVVIPRSAIVRSGGKAWVYVRVGATGFSRREIGLDQAMADGWFVAGGFTAGDEVVVAGAQTLLSDELKSQIPLSEEGD